MSTNEPKNLESDFDNLCITSNANIRMRTRSLSESVIRGLKVVNSPRRRKSLVLPSKGCKKDDSMLLSVIRPAKLHFSSFSKKSSFIRPAKLNVKSPRLLLLKPATLTIADEKLKPMKCVKFSRSPTFSNSTSFSGRIFSNNKLHNQTSFKSLIPSENNNITAVFTKSSFCKLRPTKIISAEEAANANKRENSTCSVEARIESNVPSDCDDTSIEELASYFDLFVHIPKKMSSMAEMMYI